MTGDLANRVEIARSATQPHDLQHRALKPQHRKCAFWYRILLSSLTWSGDSARSSGDSGACRCHLQAVLNSGFRVAQWSTEGDGGGGGGACR